MVNKAAVQPPVLFVMKRILLTLCPALLFCASSAFAQISYDTSGSVYLENFDSLNPAFQGGDPHPWTDNSTVGGWYASQTEYRSTNNPTITSSMYNLREGSSATDQSLGSVPGLGSGSIYFAARVVNDTGLTLTAFDLAYVGEQWRNSGNTNPSQFLVSYQFDAADITSGTWTSIGDLTFTSPHTGGTAENLNGNDPANRVGLSATISDNFQWQPGQELWLRWENPNTSGTNHGISIDDVQFSAIPEPTNLSLLFIGLATVGLLWHRNVMRKVAGRVMATVLIALPTGLLMAGDSGVERGTWHWSRHQDGHPHGTARVVGDPAKEQEVLDLYKRWNITRVYSAHRTERLLSEPDVIANWNARLHDDGRRSFLLLSNTGWIFEDQRDHLRERLQLLLDFNESRENPDERFYGVHFDVEPHILPEWKQAGPEQKRDLLIKLNEMFGDVRAYLNKNGAGEMPVYAALPVWYERLPPELGGRGSIGWQSEAERDAWWESLGESVDAVSLMAFETPHSHVILNNTEWERENFSGDVFVALRANLGTEWNQIDEMVEVMGVIEGNTKRGVDIQPFRIFAEKVGSLAPPNSVASAQPAP